MYLSTKDLDEVFFLDENALVVEQDDVWCTDGPDESVCLDHDVEVDGSGGRDVAGTADAREVQHVVVDVDDSDGLSMPNM